MRVLFGLLLLAALSAVSAQNVLNADSTNTFHITSGSAGTGWFFNGQTAAGSANPTLNMTVGTTYFISLELPTSTGHPFGLSTASTGITVTELGLVNNGSCGGSAASGYTTANNAAPFCVLSFTPNATTTTPLYYHCAFHTPMVGSIQVNGAAGAATPTPTAGTPTNSSGTATPTPTGTPTGTPTPTSTPAPPKNGTASALVPGVAVVFAAVAGFAAL